MTGKYFKTLLQRTWMAFMSPKPRRRRIALRNSLERLESRALLSAVGYEAPTIAAEVRIINAESSAPLNSVEAGRRAVVSITPRISGVAGVHEFGSAALGNGSINIVQQGQTIFGVFTAANLTSGEFEAEFKTAKARQAKGTATFLFNGEQTPETFQFSIRFFKNGALNRFRFR